MTSPREQNDPAEDSQPQPAQNAPPSRKPAWLGKPAWAAKSSRLGRPAWLVVALSLLAAIGLSVAVVHVIVGGRPLPAAVTSGQAAPGTSASPNPNATKAVPQFHVKPRAAAVIGLRSSALPVPKGLRAPIEAWYAGRGGAALAAVSGQLGTVMQASGQRQYGEMRIACLNLAADVTTAQAGPPIPDAGMQAQYAKALTEIANGAVDCRAAVTQRPEGDETLQTHVNPTMLHALSSAVAAGARDLYRATAQIAVFGRRP